MRIPRSPPQPEVVLVARCLLAQSKTEEALDLLLRLLDTAHQMGRARCSLEIQVVIVLMQAARQHIQEAKQLLRAVLSLAHTEGYLRLFLDEGAVMETLLRALVPHVREQALASYLQSILHAFAREREERGDRSPAPALASSPPIGPLSAHEQRVLCLLAAGRSNPEIARELIVSVIDQSGTFPGRDYGKLASAEAIDLAGIRLRWYDHWLKGIANGVEQDKPVCIFVMGIDEWREEDDWPLPATQFRPYYLHSHGQANTAAGDGVLAREFTGEESEDVYQYDPRDPVPTVGGGSLVPLSALDVNVGPRDQRQVETRADILCYTSQEKNMDGDFKGDFTRDTFSSLNHYSRRRFLLDLTCRQRFSRTLLRERREATLEQRYMRYTLIKMNDNVTVLAERIGALRDRCVKECMSMETPNPHLRSYLFTVRVWQEEIGTDQVEWRGKVQLVTNGDVRYFRGWTALAPLLLTMLSELDSNPEPNQ